jgi:FtsH-binding integral membrane protein
MIVGGKSEMQYSVDDYVAATIALYIDIVSLFIYMLQLFGKQRRD